jgi:nucleotide-binding universal stress UspA family protein
MAAQLKAEVHCLYVVEEPQIYATLDMGPVPIPSIDELTKSARTRLDAFVRDSITALGISATGTVLVGRPADEIVSYAKSHDAQMVIMTTHGYSGVKHLLLGSTTEAVLRHAACPVLSIRTA